MSGNDNLRVYCPKSIINRANRLAVSFVQYTIPLSITAILSLYIIYRFMGVFLKDMDSNIFCRHRRFFVFGTYTQTMAYKNNFEIYKERQKYAGVLTG